MTDAQLIEELRRAADGQTAGPMTVTILRRFAQAIADEERKECLAAMGTLHDSIVASAIMQSDETVQTLMRHCAEAGVGNAIKLVEGRGKPCGS